MAEPESDSSSKECIACAELIMANAKLCKHCGTLQNDPRFSTEGDVANHGEGAVDRKEPTFTSVTFVLQFDCLDDEINSLYNLDAQSMVEDVLNSTPIGQRIQQSFDEDSEFGIEGDISLRQTEDFIAALKQIVRYEQIDVSFDGTLDGEQSVSWTVLRKALLELRGERFAASQRWSAFEYAPVSISLKFLKPDGDEKLIDVSSRKALIEYLNELENAAKNVEGIRSFFDFYGTEIESFRGSTSSTFLNTWFSTELILTQTELQFVTGESKYFLEPTFDVNNFAWNSPSQQIPLLLEVDRAASPKNSFWFNPLPKNPYVEHSDWYWPYENAITESERRGATGAEFTKLQFIVTMWTLNFFVDEYGAEETDFPVEDFLERHQSELSNIFQLIESSEFQSLEGEISIPSDVSEFLEKLPLPENATQIWDDYLVMIGLSEN